MQCTRLNQIKELLMMMGPHLTQLSSTLYVILSHQYAYFLIILHIYIQSHSCRDNSWQLILISCCVCLGFIPMLFNAIYLYLIIYNNKLGLSWAKLSQYRLARLLTFTYLSVRLSSFEVVFLLDCIPVKLSSCEAVFL